MARPPVRAQELADVLGAQIHAGKLPPHNWLPSERELAETHGVSRSTVRQATQILAGLGLVDLVAGSGTRVRARGPAAPPEGQAVIGELAVVRRLLREADARLAAIEKRLGQTKA
jgi:DNA-binding FadR family transcriptional regulator